MRPLHVLVMLAVLCAGLGGCRKSPPLPTRPESADLISYVGVAPLGGSPVNVLIVLAQDEDQRWSGSITYRSQTLTFTEISVDSSTDSLRFAYVRDGHSHRAWALVRTHGIEVHFTAPDDIPVFQMFREISGRNMTGLWSGEMSSTLLQGQRPASMRMEQAGSTFVGEAAVNLWESWNIDLNSGSSSGAEFELSGTIYGSGNYPTFWQGNYVGYDSIGGIWAAGQQAEVDAGEFLLIRSFR